MDMTRRRFLGATSGAAAFTHTWGPASAGLTAMARQPPAAAQAGDDLEYPCTPVMHRRLQETKGVGLRIVRHRDGAVDVCDFERLVDRRTRLISVAWVSNLNGFRHDMRPLADLAHAHGAYLYADAIQLIGTGPVDVRQAGVDFLCCGGYKWLMAGFGIAPFYVRRDLLDRVSADRAGWHVEKRLGDYRYQHFKNAKKY